MKRLMIALALGFACTATVQAQSFNYGVHAGANLSNYWSQGIETLRRRILPFRPRVDEGRHQLFDESCNRDDGNRVMETIRRLCERRKRKPDHQSVQEVRRRNLMRRQHAYQQTIHAFLQLQPRTCPATGLLSASQP